MDPAEEERQARRAEERAQRYVVPALLQNIPSAPVWNRGRRRGRFHMTLAHVPQTLENAILDLHRRQLAEQQQRITQEYRAQVITRVEAERQRQEVVQRDRGVEVEGQRQVEINQMIEEWRNEDADALDYEEQQNRRDIQELDMQDDVVQV